MDREAIARAARRREADEALAAERDRAGELRAEIERLVADLGGAAVDEAAYVRMSPDDVALVRTVIEPPAVPEPDLEADESWALYEDDDEPGAGGPLDPRTETEAEIARLEQEIVVSARLQAALERYIDALEQEPGPGTAG